MSRNVFLTLMVAFDRHNNLMSPSDHYICNMLLQNRWHLNANGSLALKGKPLDDKIITCITNTEYIVDNQRFRDLEAALRWCSSSHEVYLIDDSGLVGQGLVESGQCDRLLVAHYQPAPFKVNASLYDKVNEVVLPSSCVDIFEKNIESLLWDMRCLRRNKRRA